MKFGKLGYRRTDIKTQVYSLY